MENNLDAKNFYRPDPIIRKGIGDMILVLFVEGDTEVEFYRQVIAHARKLCPNGMFDTGIEYKSRTFKLMNEKSAYR